jgi:hypothetical protein
MTRLLSHSYFKHLLVFIVAGVLAFMVLPGIAHGQVNYTPLAPIEAEGFEVRTDLTGFLIDVFRFTIAISAALAVLLIILGGVQYMSTDAISGKKEGRERIKQALIGLFLVIICYLVLWTVNPDIVDLKFLKTIESTPGKQDPIIGGPAATRCPLSVESCYVNASSAQTSPGKVCAIVKLKGEIYRYDCSKAISFNQNNNAACQQKLAFWNGKKPEVSACYVDANSARQNPGKLCVVVKFDNQILKYDCSKDLSADSINQASAECKNKRQFWIDRGYSASACYANLDQQANQPGKFCIPYTKNNVTEYDCSGSLSAAGVINQTSGACNDVRSFYDKPFTVGACYANVSQQKKTPGKFCIPLSIGGEMVKEDCSGDIVIDQTTGVCGDYKSYWNGRKVSC